MTARPLIKSLLIITLFSGAAAFYAYLIMVFAQVSYTNALFILLRAVLLTYVMFFVIVGTGYLVHVIEKAIEVFIWDGKKDT